MKTIGKGAAILVGVAVTLGAGILATIATLTVLANKPKGIRIPLNFDE